MWSHRYNGDQGIPENPGVNIQHGANNRKSDRQGEGDHGLPGTRPRRTANLRSRRRLFRVQLLHGIDKFWSGVASQAKYGLEISVLACINVTTGKATFLDATQTPSGLSKKEGTKYSRTDFYLEQILDCLKSLPTIIYYVTDGFYAKEKIVNGLTSNGKHLITKLLSDANLKYLNQKPRFKGQKGASRKYNGKVDFKKNGVSDLSKWVLVGSDENILI